MNKAITNKAPPLRALNVTPAPKGRRVAHLHFRGEPPADLFAPTDLLTAWSSVVEDLAAKDAGAPSVQDFLKIRLPDEDSADTWQ